MHRWCTCIVPGKSEAALTPSGLGRMILIQGTEVLIHQSILYLVLSELARTWSTLLNSRWKASQIYMNLHIHDVEAHNCNWCDPQIFQENE